MNRLLPLSLAVALALGSNAALALGLGGINVKSELNEPLRAEIPVYVSSPAEAESLRVELAAGAEFARVGLDINDIAVPLEFDVGKNARGEPVILVKSNQAIREPTLTFLVEVNWSNGRFLREYSVLLE
nr:fimbrial protein FimV [Xanthomonadales bacterium]